VILKHHADAPAQFRNAAAAHLGEVLAIQRDHAMRRTLDQPEHVQQRALAGAGVAGDEGHLAAGHFKGELRQRLVAAVVAFADLIEMDHRASPNLLVVWSAARIREAGTQ
jgi:hypothetical protein